MPPSCSCWCPLRVVCLLLVLGTFGCNAFSGIQPEATRVDDLLSDARIAIKKGEHQRAVRLLETAFDKDSADVEVRIELANALYAAHGVDVLSVRSAIDHVNGTGAGAETLAENTGDCTEPAPPADSTAQFLSVSFERDDAVGRLATEIEQFRRVSALVLEGVLQRRMDAFGEEPPRVRAKGYLIAALARVSTRLVLVRNVLQGTESTLYVAADSEGPREIAACGPTSGDVAQVEDALCRLGQSGVRAVAWLRSRNDLVGSEQTSLLIDPLETHVDALRASLSCSGTTVS